MTLHTFTPQTTSCERLRIKHTKATIAAGFNKQASQYNRYAKVQQDIAHVALSQFSKELNTTNTLLDLGCGTGAYMSRLQAFTSTLIGLDLSRNMLLQARANLRSKPAHPSSDSQSDNDALVLPSYSYQSAFVQADAESLPFINGSIDAVFSSMALQWCSQPEALIQEVHRVLSANGKATLAIMVDGSFERLHQAYGLIGVPSRVNRFAAREDWLNACEKLPWRLEYEEQIFDTQHTSVLDMLRSIKRVGANAKVNGISASNESSANYTQNSNVVTEKGTRIDVKSLNSASTKQANAADYMSRMELKRIDEILNNTGSGLSLDYKVMFLNLYKSE